MTERLTRPQPCRSRREPDCLGAILAGGRSRRMGGRRKALLPLAGRPLLAHVIERLEPQVGTLVLSVDRPASDLDRFGLQQVPDPCPGSKGPLGGLSASVKYAADEGYGWVLLAPCDAPVLPPDLATRLRMQAEETGEASVVARYGGRLQPVFSLWSVGLRCELETAVTRQGQGGFLEFLATRRHGVLDWREAPVDPFFNINDRAALAEAERLWGRKQEKPA